MGGKEGCCDPWKLLRAGHGQSHLQRYLGRKDFLPVEPQNRPLLPLSPRSNSGSPKTTPVPSVWLSPDLLPPPRRPLQRKSTVYGLNGLRAHFVINLSVGTCEY